ncbi:CPBP family intramembrane glutamic endopeptidase [Haladaptatus halobius]|uniref:CPBP family intramembrane glutamic endopeptidase n=1 Tax=Haladaptatus halobius TaxID=2884875 RepID=UPI001D0A830B|nr:CPBP family intramembrane glutamic endopeptidase [Haladaptatus halobius]
MPAPNWNAFTAVVLLVLAVLIALARASQAMLAGPREENEVERSEDDGTARLDNVTAESEAVAHTAEPETTRAGESETAGHATKPGVSGHTAEPATPAVEPAEELTPGKLLLNVALSQGLFGAVLVGAAVLAAIPPAALGAASPTLLEFGAGVALGGALFAANELGQRGADALGIDYEDGLREMLTPDSPGGWLLLLGVVLPVIAGFEEFLFRAALVGALTAGYGVSPWLLVVGSTVAFAVGHGAQGTGGILVTGALGGVLAAAFVLSGSLLVVVVAHYLVNALEFVVHAGRGT